MSGNNNEDAPVVPLGMPPLRQWELNASSTRYDRLVAAPSDSTMRYMWSSWVVIQGFLTCFVATVFISILRSKYARRNPFNIYLVYLMIPDLVFGGFCTITCLCNAIVGHYLAPWMCRFQAFYLIWGISGNAWLNAVVAWQLHLMLTSSFVRRKYQVPTRRRVSLHAAIVFVYATFLASWGLWWRPPGTSSDGNSGDNGRMEWWPHRPAAASGLGCSPLEYNTTSTIFFYALFLPLAVLIPLVYVIYVCFDIWRRKLMPPTGRRRLLSIYFTRIVAAFVIMWIPYLIMVFAAGGWPVMVFVGGTWGHLQGAVSASMSLYKPDVRKATLDFLQSCRRGKCCCSCHGPDDYTSRSSRSIMFSSLMGRRWSSLKRSSLSMPRQSSRPQLHQQQQGTHGVVDMQAFEKNNDNNHHNSVASDAHDVPQQQHQQQEHGSNWTSETGTRTLSSDHVTSDAVNEDDGGGTLCITPYSSHTSRSGVIIGSNGGCRQDVNGGQLQQNDEWVEGYLPRQTEDYTYEDEVVVVVQEEEKKKEEESLETTGERKLETTLATKPDTKEDDEPLEPV